MENFTKKQEILNNFLNSGNKLVQINSKNTSTLFMGDEKLNGKVWISYMFKRFGSANYRTEMKNFVVIK
jgi:hypothetical protein